MSRTESVESSAVWTAIVVLVAGCITGSTITAMLRDARTGYGYGRTDHRVVFQLGPTSRQRTPRREPRRMPRPVNPVPPLDQFLPQQLPLPARPEPMVSQQHPAPHHPPAEPPAQIALPQPQPSPTSTEPPLGATSVPARTAEQILLDIAAQAARQAEPSVRPQASSEDVAVIADDLPPVPSMQATPDAPRERIERETGVQKEPLAALPELTTDQQRSVRAAISRVEPRVESLVAAGMEAGRRNASFTARDKMLDALRLLAQTADTAAGVTLRTEQLKRGIIAVEESAEFARNSDVFDTTLSPSRLVAKHRSQIVNPEDASSMTHLALQRLYLEFAQESLAAAAADSPAGSQALVGIAKFYLVRAATDGMKREGPRAVALCQAALVVDPNNFSAANELGALLAQYGRLQDAKQMLLNSLRSQPTIAAWHNLAVVHQRLGESDLADLARKELQSLQQQQGMTARNVGWVDKEAFARTHPGPGGSDHAAFNTSAAPSQTAPPTQAQSTANNRWIR